MQTEVMRSGDTGCNLPVNLKRLIENAQRKFGCRPHKRGFTGESRRDGQGSLVAGRASCSSASVAGERLLQYLF